MESEHKYDDIINLPHHVSKNHPPLSVNSYAAQFSPFEALSGYDSIISETARITDKPIELDENNLEILTIKLKIISDRISQHPTLEFTYFKKDEKKPGGAFLEKVGQVKSISENKRLLYFIDGTELSLDDIVDINGSIFNSFENEHI